MKIAKLIRELQDILDNIGDLEIHLFVEGIESANAPLQEIKFRTGEIEGEDAFIELRGTW